MFGIFKKKNSGKLDYYVYRTEVAKYKMLIKYIMDNQSTPLTIVSFFEETFIELEKLIVASGISAGNVLYPSLNEIEGEIILAELHPLKSVMDALFLNHQKQPTINCFVAIDNAFFNTFGGERVVSLMDKLGMEEFEAINHSMVNKSIERAQAKIESKVLNPKPSKSLEEWLSANLPKNN